MSQNSEKNFRRAEDINTWLSGRALASTYEICYCVLTPKNKREKGGKERQEGKSTSKTQINRWRKILKIRTEINGVMLGRISQGIKIPICYSLNVKCLP